jgi:hypothetical protein
MAESAVLSTAAANLTLVGFEAVSQFSLVFDVHMKIATAVVLLILSGTRVATAQNIRSTPDSEVLVAVLEQAVIRDSIINWALDPKVTGLVVSTASLPCALPIGADESLRQNAALERAANGEKVGPSELIAKPPARDKDLQVAPGPRSFRLDESPKPDVASGPVPS